MTRSIAHTTRALAALLGTAAAIALTGCGMTGSSIDSSKAPGQGAATAPAGSVHGGQQPIQGATIQLFAVNTTTAKGASTAIPNATAITDGNGHFSLPAYTCPTNAQVYILSSGGNPGVGGGLNNSITLLAALGPCSALSASTFININEITTVAGVFALAPFMADATHIGADAAHAQGLTNAFDTSQELVSFAYGTPPGPNLPSNVTEPTTKLITLANAIAACVNSANGSANCNTLFADATPPAGTAPGDTATAVANIAHYPANNAADIFNKLVLADAAFQPPNPMTSAPSDWTMPLTVSGGGLAAPYGLAVDASNNVWVANEAGFDVSEFTRLGAAKSANGFSGGGILAPQGVAVDLSGNVWVANSGGSNVVKLDANGNVLSGTNGYTAGSVNAPVSIAVDKAGNAWVANFLGDSVTELDTNGNALSSSPISLGTGAAPTSVALDPNGSVWVNNSGSGNVSKLNGTGAPAVNSPYTDGLLQGGANLATTSASSVFVTAPGNSTLSAFSSSGAALGSSPISGGGLNGPEGIAADGSDVLWVANNSGTLAAFTAAGSAVPTQNALGSVSAPAAVAIDASGNVWTANSGNDTLTVYVGLAAPAVVPLAANIH